MWALEEKGTVGHSRGVTEKEATGDTSIPGTTTWDQGSLKRSAIRASFLSEGTDPETPITMMSHDCEDVKRGPQEHPPPGTASVSPGLFIFPARHFHVTPHLSAALPTTPQEGTTLCCLHQVERKSSQVALSDRMPLGLLGNSVSVTWMIRASQ